MAHATPGPPQLNLKGSDLKYSLFINHINLSFCRQLDPHAFLRAYLRQWIRVVASASLLKYLNIWPSLFDNLLAFIFRVHEGHPAPALDFSKVLFQTP
jgi:hypothetical protein